MADAKPKKPQKQKKKMLGFAVPDLTETQWAMVGAAVVFALYFSYEFLTADVTTDTSGANVAMQPFTGETEEQRFKRENKDAALPDGSAVPKNILEQRTKLTQQIPFGDPSLEFRVRLPVTWVMSEFARYGLPGQESYPVLTNIARYFGPAIEDVRPFLWVEVERMTRYMKAETWARSYMIKRGISPQALNVHSPTDVQALYVDVRDLRSYAVRSRFVISGNKMILVSFGVPINSYKHYKDMMGLALNSFTLIRPGNEQIEEIKNVSLLNIVNFQHYASWLPKNQYIESTLHPSIELHNPQEINNPKGDLLQGLILVYAFRKSMQSGPEEQKSQIRDRLQELRMTLGDKPAESKSLSLRDGLISAVQDMYLAQVNTYIRKEQFDIIKSEESKTTQEVWITTLDNGYYTVYATLITPLKATNYVIWAQNMAAYELLIETLKIRTRPAL